MTPSRHEQSHPPSPAPLLAAIAREIRERREALQELERSWREALLMRDLVRVRSLADRAAQHRRQLTMARAERATYSSWMERTSS